MAQLTSVEHVRDSLPLDFLIATGQHEEVLRRRLGHLLRVLDHSRLSAMRHVFGYWKEGVRLEQSREFSIHIHPFIPVMIVGSVLFCSITREDPLKALIY